jgi:hypothetical protein
VFDDVPILSSVLTPLKRTTAGLADFFFTRGDAFRLGFAIGHARWM